jgi:large subunit ribosomal protein L24
MAKGRFEPKLKIKKGDKVQVIAGAYRGTEGQVLEIFPAKNRAVVDGVNLMKKHQKPSNNNAGGITEINTSIHLSNLMLIDPKNGEPTRVGRKLVDGKLQRYSKKSGEIIK